MWPVIVAAGVSAVVVAIPLVAYALCVAAGSGDRRIEQGFRGRGR